jgi:hypothetical protein
MVGEDFVETMVEGFTTGVDEDPEDVVQPELEIIIALEAASSI